MPPFDLLEAPYGNVIGLWVTYWGSQDAWHGKDFLIIDQGKDNEKKIAFLVDGVIQWRTLGASFSQPFQKGDNFASKAIDDFLNPHQDTKNVVKAEIKRLEERLAELKLSLKVLDSL